MHSAFLEFAQALGTMYRERPAWWRHDAEQRGFSWIDVSDRGNSVISYVPRDSDDEVVVVNELQAGAPAAWGLLGQLPPGAAVRLRRMEENPNGTGRCRDELAEGTVKAVLHKGKRKPRRLMREIPPPHRLTSKPYPPLIGLEMWRRSVAASWRR